MGTLLTFEPILRRQEQLRERQARRAFASDGVGRSDNVDSSDMQSDKMGEVIIFPGVRYSREPVQTRHDTKIENGSNISPPEKAQ